LRREVERSKKIGRGLEKDVGHRGTPKDVLVRFVCGRKGQRITLGVTRPGGTN